MKNLFIIFFLSLSFNLYASSEDYSCSIRNYQIDLSLTQDRSTHIWISDTQTYRTIAQAYAGSIGHHGNKVTYYFYPASSPIELTIKKQDFDHFPETLKAYIETEINGFLLWENIRCHRR